MKRLQFLIAYTCWAFGLVGVLGACQSSSKKDISVEDKTPTDTVRPQTQTPTTVEFTQGEYDMAGIRLGQPERRSMSQTLRVNGVVDVPAQNRVSVSVPYGGYIRQIALEPGKWVRKGQTLVVLENPDYIQLQQDYLDTKAKLGYADLEYARQEELSRENVTALKVFQQTRANRQSLQAQLAGQRQRLAMLGINTATLTPDRLTRTIAVPSPVTGYITDIPANRGRFANPSDVLVQLTDVSHLHIQLNVFEQDIKRIKVGQPVHFGLGAEGPLAHKGDIFLIGKEVAPDRTIPVLAHPDEPTNRFVPGGYVTAQIDLATEPMTTLPDTAVVSLRGQSYVYILERKEPSRFVFRQVEVQPGLRQNGYVAVTLPADIDPRQTPIVVRGTYSLLSKINNSEEE